MQRVVLNENFSDCMQAMDITWHSGVAIPQNPSYIGPLLFLLFVNDMLIFIGFKFSWILWVVLSTNKLIF